MSTTLRIVLLAALVGVGGGVYFAAKEGYGSSGNPNALTETAEEKPQASSGQAGHAGWRQNPFAAGGGADNVSADPAAVRHYGRNGRAVDLDGLPAAQFIDKWSILARGGDHQAAYRVYQAESLCSAAGQAAPKFHTESDHAVYLSEHAEMTKLCEGVTPAQVQERYRFLADAAHAGNVQAQIDYYMDAPYGHSLKPTTNQDDALLLQWKGEALANLKSAANAGEPFALGLLSQTYSTGELAVSDAKMSLAYRAAEAEVRNISLSETQLRRRYGKLAASDFDDAMKLGAQIAQACCRK